MFTKDRTIKSNYKAITGTHSGPGFRRLVVCLMIAALAAFTFSVPVGAVEKKKKAKAKSSAVQRKTTKKTTAKRSANSRTTKRKTAPRTTTGKNSSAPSRAGRYHNFIDKDHNGIDDRAQRSVNKLGKRGKVLHKSKTQKRQTAKKITAKRTTSNKSTSKKTTVKKASSKNPSTSKKKSKAKKSRNYKKKPR